MVFSAAEENEAIEVSCRLKVSHGEAYGRVENSSEMH